MKIGPYHIGRDGFYREQALDVDTARLFGAGKQVAYKVDSLNDLYDLYSKHDLCRGMIDDLSEAACGQGMYTTVERVTEKLKKNKSKDLCDQFSKLMNLDGLLPKVCKNTLIAGFCPVETKINSDPEKSILKIVHPRTITEIQTDPATGDVLKAKQKVGDKELVLDGKNLAWFTYGNLANDPRGLSFISSILDILTTLDNATTTVTTIADRYISPITVWKSRLPSATLKENVQKREAGDAIFLGSLTGEEMKENTVTVIQADPRVPYWEFVKNLQTRLYAYGRASNVYMTKNANLASAEKMEDIVARHVASIQREIKRIVEKRWYEPLILTNSLEEVPRLNFGKQPTGVQGIAPAEIINKGLDLGYINQLQYYEILKNLGVRVTEELGLVTEEKPQKPTETPQKQGETPQITAEQAAAMHLILPWKTVKTTEETAQPIQYHTTSDAATPLPANPPNQLGVSGNAGAGPWGCANCGYTMLNPMIAHNKIICPQCGFFPAKGIFVKKPD